MLLLHKTPHDTTEADSILHKHGYEVRLADAIFQNRALQPSASAVRTPPPPPPPLQIDDFLSPGDFAWLQRAFCPSGEFFLSHGYAQQRSYYSYLFPLGTPPRLGMEGLLRQVLAAAATYVPELTEAKTAEW